MALGDILTIDAALAASGLALIATLHHHKVSRLTRLGLQRKRHLAHGTLQSKPLTLTRLKLLRKWRPTRENTEP